MILAMMSWLIPLVLNAEEPESVCARLLGVPASFALQFAEYKVPAYLPPLSPANFEPRAHPDSVDMDIRYADPFADLAIDVSGYFQEEAQARFEFEMFDPQPPIPVDLAWRVVVAHLLDRYPTLQTIVYHVHNIHADHANILAGLMRGADLAEAIGQTHFVRALTEFGFVVKTYRHEYDPEMTVTERMMLTITMTRSKD